MSRTCEHIQDDGLRCINPAMYRRQVCFHHWRLLRPSAPVNDVAYVPPTLDCEASVSIVCANILRSLFAGKITPKFAQSAMTCVRETAKSLRLQGKVGKAGDRSATHLTPFMADYFSTLDQMQAKSAAAYPDPQPLIYPAHFADVPEEKQEGEEMNDVDKGFGVGTGRNHVGTDLPVCPPRAQLAVCADRSEEAEFTTALENVDTGFQARVSAAPTAESSSHHDRRNDRGRAGLQPRVAGSENDRALAPVEIAPAGAADKKPPLSLTQAKLLKKILRRGPKHPQFHLAARLLDLQVSRGTS